ncbi:MAG: type III-A CRISPR-associated RAMP protein Csm3, partial [Anaerolineae bacterium]
DVARLETLITRMHLLEDDYLGGFGSPGSGKLRINDIRLSIRTNGSYLDQPESIGEYATLTELLQKRAEIVEKVKKTLGLGKAQ